MRNVKKKIVTDEAMRPVAVLYQIRLIGHKKISNRHNYTHLCNPLSS